MVAYLISCPVFWLILMFLCWVHISRVCLEAGQDPSFQWPQSTWFSVHQVELDGSIHTFNCKTSVSVKKKSFPPYFLISLSNISTYKYFLFVLPLPLQSLNAFLICKSLWTKRKLLNDYIAVSVKSVFIIIEPNQVWTP